MFWKRKAPDPDMEKLVLRVARLELELTDLSDRVQHWMKRGEGREARAPKPSTNGNGGGTDAISARIWARRARASEVQRERRANADS